MDNMGSELKQTAPKTRENTSFSNFDKIYLPKSVVFCRIFIVMDDYRKINENKRK